MSSVGTAQDFNSQGGWHVFIKSYLRVP